RRRVVPLLRADHAPRSGGALRERATPREGEGAGAGQRRTDVLSADRAHASACRAGSGQVGRESRAAHRGATRFREDRRRAHRTPVHGPAVAGASRADRALRPGRPPRLPRDVTLMIRRQPSPSQAGGESPRMAWRLHQEVVLLAAWGRALLLQLAHPLVAQGVLDHTGLRAERWGLLLRLDRPVRAMLALTFGSAEEAEDAARAIRAVHKRVHGQLATAKGALPTRAYSAEDPLLLTWVHATLLDSYLLTYELLVQPLAAD